MSHLNRQKKKKRRKFPKKDGVRTPKGSPYVKKVCQFLENAFFILFLIAYPLFREAIESASPSKIASIFLYTTSP